jgi:aspartate/glutamate racemase
MGPAATADFYAKLVLATPARVDHIDSTQCLAEAVVTRSSLEV